MTEANRTQAEYWASAAGLKWIEHEEALDTAMSGMLGMMLDAAEIQASDRVLDIGCGTGASTLGAAHRVPAGEVLGVDISAPLLDRARDRARRLGIGNAAFLLADAQSHVFDGPPFGVLVSRIGMSFFSDTVAGLRNLAGAMAPGGRMAFVSWAGTDINPWFLLPRIAAEARLGPAPNADPNAPGPTAFQDAARVAALMHEAGLFDISAAPVEIVLTPPNGIPGAAAASRVGPAARIMKAHRGTRDDEAAIEDAVATAFAPFETDGAVVVPAVVNLFTCTT
ncbi:class I SAM-dependent methyltransferase [Sinisalibacter aestuarii]|uniref:Methyltransferase n=1 Tax=Sinisalibacter aestuarii TaxID=2949426 RepID=A0ABQ5LSG7_9RHOB|nr:class I SAM-dependent methyltransferase [Sinisalibacter aestuarii]GKY87355.1 methyltransferase [Sinisalibacter aestuarii]